MRKISLFILILFLSNCGYAPIYNSENKTKIKINVLSAQGDKKINNFLISEIKKLSRNDYEKEFNINISTNFNKFITAKDSKGVASNYELKLVAKFEIVKPNENKFFSFEEKIDIKNNTNLFEQKKYENNIKITFTKSIIDKLIDKLSINE